MLRHGSCDCVHIKQYLASAARVIGGFMTVGARMGVRGIGAIELSRNCSSRGVSGAPRREMAELLLSAMFLLAEIMVG